MPWVLGDDFNVVCFAEERKDEDYNYRGRQEFNSLICDLGLRRHKIHLDKHVARSKPGKT